MTLNNKNGQKNANIILATTGLFCHPIIYNIHFTPASSAIKQRLAI